MTAVRDSLCNMEPVQIPRPQISGLQFIPTRGRLGFYATIRRDGEKYGVGMKSIGPRRPTLSDDLFKANSDIQKSSSTPTADTVKQVVKCSSEQDLGSIKVQNAVNNSNSSSPGSNYQITDLNKQ